ncbi:MAG: hypothetical protein VXV96_14680 [Bdellovibrionota bacterium]|nr:hypothetical protein [Bdellovibrionota bacterium]
METEKLSPVQKLHKVIKSVDVIDVFLSKSSFELLTHPKLVDASQTNIVVDTDYSWSKSVGDETSFLFCEIHSKILGKDTSPEGVEKDKYHFQIDATFSIVYDLFEPSLDDECFDIFSKTNAEFNAHSYLREYIQSTCARMGLPQLVLPFKKPKTASQINKQFEQEAESEEK